MIGGKLFLDHWGPHSPWGKQQAGLEAGQQQGAAKAPPARAPSCSSGAQHGDGLGSSSATWLLLAQVQLPRPAVAAATDLERQDSRAAPASEQERLLACVQAAVQRVVPGGRVEVGAVDPAVGWRQVGQAADSRQSMR